MARYASGSSTSVVLRYGHGRTTLSIEDKLPGARSAPPSGGGLADVGGGGLAGMRERSERLGGSAQAGPTDEGWRVELDVPA